MPRVNARQQQLFHEEKQKALLGLLEALGSERIPNKGGLKLRTGGIIKCFDESFLPMRTQPLLEVLYEAQVPHNKSIQFTARVLHNYKEQLSASYRDLVGASEIKLNLLPDLPQVEPESEPEPGPDAEPAAPSGSRG